LPVVALFRRSTRGRRALRAAYLTFLYALVVCPNQDMWVMSVQLYQYQNNAATSAVFASVLVASIPTLLVFVLAQNVIMRGIVVPTEE
jgi:multiple sugar transport system permease protein